MKKMLSFASAIIFAAASFAQVTGSLFPASGNYYPTDQMNQGNISVSYTDTIDVTNASAIITAGTTTYPLTLEDVFATGFSLAVPTLADGAFSLVISGIVDKAGTAVANVTGNYTYKAAFPLTGVAPASGDTLTTKTATVVFSFNPNVTYTSIVITSGSVTTTLVGSTAPTNSVSVALLESYWGTPAGGYNNISIALKGTKDADGTSISNASGSIGTIIANYKIEDASTGVTFLGTDPADDGWTYAEDLMGWEIAFNYSDTVVMGNATTTAIINYLDSIDADIADPVEIPAANVNGMYNYRGGYYALFIPIPEAPIYDAGTVLAKMTITVQGLTYNGTAVATKTASFDAAPATAFRAPTRGSGDDGATGIQAETVEVDKLVNIYSAQGLLIKKNVPASTVNTLNQGLYIVGNEKVFVK